MAATAVSCDARRLDRFRTADGAVRGSVVRRFSAVHDALFRAKIDPGPNAPPQSGPDGVRPSRGVAPVAAQNSPDYAPHSVRLRAQHFAGATFSWCSRATSA